MVPERSGVGTRVTRVVCGKSWARLAGAEGGANFWRMETGAPEAAAVARASYARCVGAPDFIGAFYDRLFELCPEAKPRFAETNFERQNKLLRHAFGLLLSFPTEPTGEPTILSRIAEQHSRRVLGIDPSLYPPFLESLIDTVKRYDPMFTPEVERAWRTTLEVGVAYMLSRY